MANMRWAALLLAFGNLALAGYLLFIDRGSSPGADVSALEFNADKLKHIKRPAGNAASPKPQQGAACLEWSKLHPGDLVRAQEELAKLNPGKSSLHDGAIVIMEPHPTLVARIAELKAEFAGTELKAVVCPGGMG